MRVVTVGPIEFLRGFVEHYEAVGLVSNVFLDPDAADWPTRLPACRAVIAINNSVGDRRATLVEMVRRAGVPIIWVPAHWESAHLRLIAAGLVPRPSQEAPSKEEIITMVSAYLGVETANGKRPSRGEINGAVQRVFARAGLTADDDMIAAAHDIMDAENLLPIPGRRNQPATNREEPVFHPHIQAAGAYWNSLTFASKRRILQWVRRTDRDPSKTRSVPRAITAKSGPRGKPKMFAALILIAARSMDFQIVKATVWNCYRAAFDRNLSPGTNKIFKEMGYEFRVLDPREAAQRSQAARGKTGASKPARTPATDQASPTGVADPSADAGVEVLFTEPGASSEATDLKMEIRRLRRENAQLQQENEGLKSEVDDLNALIKTYEARPITVDEMVRSKLYEISIKPVG